jgi:hypothetical protein
MTNTMHPITCTSRDHKDRSLYSLEGEAELEQLDRQAGHDYLPMDVYVDPRTVKEHFQDSSIRVRWRRIHPGARRHDH